MSSILSKVIEICRLYPEVAECSYLLSQYRGDEPIDELLPLLKLRYGGRFRNVLSMCLLVLKLSEEERSTLCSVIATELRKVLEELVLNRIKSEGDRAEKVLKVFAKYCSSEVDLDTLSALMELATGTGAELLLKLGILNKVSRDTVLVPQYVYNILAQYAELPEEKHYIPIYERFMSLVEAKPYVLAIIENYLVGDDVDYDLLYALYGVNYEDAIKEVYVPEICKLTRSGTLVVNPLTTQDTVLCELFEVKTKVARDKMSHVLVLPGQVEFDTRVRALVSYMYLPETGGSLAILLFPWFAPSRRVLYWNWRANRIVVLLGKPRPEFLELVTYDRKLDRTAWLFMSEHTTLHYIPPKYEASTIKKFLEELRDEGFEIIEVT